LTKVEEVAAEERVRFSGVKKSSSQDPDSRFAGHFIDSVDDAARAIAANAQLLAGTAWLFAEPALEGALDYLFVDEAGQVSLANLLASGTAARNLVLLGDQMQLGQPIQGVHPGRSGESTLDFLLDGLATIPPDRGIFLPTTWRMHADVCRFISDAVYDGRLAPEPANQRQTLLLDARAHPALRPTGIVFLPLAHDGNSQRSPEEADAIKALYSSLLAQRFRNKQGRAARGAPQSHANFGFHNVPRLHADVAGLQLHSAFRWHQLVEVSRHAKELRASVLIGMRDGHVARRIVGVIPDFSC
jgi:hypothetical protein